MPVYFAHGFRWPRAGFTGIRVHVVFHNLEDCSAEYVQNAHSQGALLDSFRRAWPDVMRELDNGDEGHGGRGRGLTLLEEYDPEDESSEHAVSRPWAFVCDMVRVLPTGKVVETSEVGAGGEGAEGAGVGKGKAIEGGSHRASRVPGGVEGSKGPGAGGVVMGPVLSLNVSELIAQGPGSTPKAWEALADLRDKIADGEKIDWWVIYNGDPERAWDDESEYDEDEDDDDGDEEEEEEGKDVVVGGGEQGEEVYQDQQPNRKTFVPQDEAILQRNAASSNNPAPAPALQGPPHAHAHPPAMEMLKTAAAWRGATPPPVPPAKDKDRGKRTPGMRAFPPPEKLMPPPPVPPPVAKPAVKSESGLKKKFFGKK